MQIDPTFSLQRKIRVGGKSSSESMACLCLRGFGRAYRLEAPLFLELEG